jgi:hypothetical protein
MHCLVPLVGEHILGFGARTAGDHSNLSPNYRSLLIWVIYPLVDLRAFTEAEALIDKPWTRTSLDSFLRRFGPLKYSRLDSDTSGEWLRAAEPWYISAARFARVLPKNAHQRLDMGGQVYLQQATSARLFSDAVLNARLEIVLRIDGPPNIKPTDALLSDILETEVEVRKSRPGKRAPARSRVKLKSLGGEFLRAYRRARESKPQSDVAGNGDEGDDIRLLDPIVLVLTAPDIALRKPRVGWRKEVRTGYQNFRVLVVTPSANPAASRSVRRSLVRLYFVTQAIQVAVKEMEDRGDVEVGDKAAQRLTSLLQQTHDGVEHWKRHIEMPLPLTWTIDELGALAERLANRLKTGGASILPQLRRISETTELAARPLLDNSQIELVHGALVQALVGRGALVAGLDPEIIGSLPVIPAPSEQYWSDLKLLNRRYRRDGVEPLLLYLRSATALMAGEADHKAKLVKVRIDLEHILAQR